MYLKARCAMSWVSQLCCFVFYLLRILTCSALRSYMLYMGFQCFNAKDLEFGRC